VTDPSGVPLRRVLFCRPGERHRFMVSHAAELVLELGEDHIRVQKSSIGGIVPGEVWQRQLPSVFGSTDDEEEPIP
jgi:hypothetical protein